MNIKNALDFLRDLEENNNREWFHANKYRYDEIKIEFETLINALIERIISFEPSIAGITAKECVFRIYKDTRFSKDKTPYKTHLGAYITKGGRGSKLAGYYFHIQPSESFIGGGIYCPEPAELKKVREEIYYNIDQFKKITLKKEFKQFFPTIEGDKLVNPPKGYPKEFEEIELLKHKSWVAWHGLSDKKLATKDLLDYITNACLAMHPFNEFFNVALSEI